MEEALVWSNAWQLAADHADDLVILVPARQREAALYHLREIMELKWLVKRGQETASVGCRKGRSTFWVHFRTDVFAEATGELAWHVRPVEEEAFGTWSKRSMR